MSMVKIFRPKESILVFIQVLTFFAFVWAVLNSHDGSLWAASFFIWFLITCLGITVTFHRLLAHRAYRVALPIEIVFSLFANLGCTGSSLGWVYIHRKHHRFSDLPGDPHSPKTLGFLGSIIGDYKLETAYLWSIRDIIKKPVHKFFHNYHLLLILVLALALYFISFKALVHFYLIPVFFNVIVSRFSNWIDHSKMFGHINYKTSDCSRNVWWWAIISFGEGWHNNHHADPRNYRIGKKLIEFDPGRYVIKLLILTGLAYEKNTRKAA